MSDLRIKATFHGIYQRQSGNWFHIKQREGVGHFILVEGDLGLLRELQRGEEVELLYRKNGGIRATTPHGVYEFRN